MDSDVQDSRVDRDDRDSLDDLAAFLMHHSSDEILTPETQLVLYAVVAAYQEGAASPPVLAELLRTVGAGLSSAPGYRPEWAPSTLRQPD